MVEKARKILDTDRLSLLEEDGTRYTLAAPGEPGTLTMKCEKGGNTESELEYKKENSGKIKGPKIKITRYNGDEYENGRPSVEATAILSGKEILQSIRLYNVLDLGGYSYHVTIKKGKNGKQKVGIVNANRWKRENLYW